MGIAAIPEAAVTPGAVPTGPKRGAGARRHHRPGRRLAGTGGDRRRAPRPRLCSTARPEGRRRPGVGERDAHTWRGPSAAGSRVRATPVGVSQHSPPPPLLRPQGHLHVPLQRGSRSPSPPPADASGSDASPRPLRRAARRRTSGSDASPRPLRRAAHGLTSGSGGGQRPSPGAREGGGALRGWRPAVRGGVQGEDAVSWALRGGAVSSESGGGPQGRHVALVPGDERSPATRRRRPRHAEVGPQAPTAGTRVTGSSGCRGWLWVLPLRTSFKPNGLVRVCCEGARMARVAGPGAGPSGARRAAGGCFSLCLCVQKRTSEMKNIC
ncbi:translation initiation factor IF-2-like [Meles meles]|uniref:translation initiation factor IF-2-like n=1 Tax=Meles meles TaxID=9662 RepID=UPI001E69FDB0|nr:translation initiation factor IF-2-like [Meles meles]